MRASGREVQCAPADAEARGSVRRMSEDMPALGLAGDAGELGQALVTRMLSAGLDVSFALMVVHDGPAVVRLRHAVDELDAAIADLRGFLFSVPGAVPGGNRSAEAGRSAVP